MVEIIHLPPEMRKIQTLILMRWSMPIEYRFSTFQSLRRGCDITRLAYFTLPSSNRRSCLKRLRFTVRFRHASTSSATELNDRLSSNTVPEPVEGSALTSLGLPFFRTLIYADVRRLAFMLIFAGIQGFAALCFFPEFFMNQIY